MPSWYSSLTDHSTIETSAADQTLEASADPTNMDGLAESDFQTDADVNPTIEAQRELFAPRSTDDLPSETGEPTQLDTSDFSSTGDLRNQPPVDIEPIPESPEPTEPVAPATESDKSLTYQALFGSDERSTLGEAAASESSESGQQGWVAPLPPEGDVWQSPADLARSEGFSQPVTVAGQPPAGAIAPQTSSTRPRMWPMILVALLAGFFGTLLAVGGLFALGVLETPQETLVASPPVTAAPPVTIIERVTQLVNDGESEGVAAAVGAKVIPSIVTVFTYSDELETGSGSGVVMSEDGYIISNDHVVADSTAWEIAFNDGRRYSATLVGTDPLTDLAVLRIDAIDLVPIEFGATAVLSIGDTAIAVGSPLGLDGGPSLTVGVVSAFNRSVGVGTDAGDRLFGMIQTDAPITLGSSGGALVDHAGRLIGITTAIGVSSAGAEGIGFATPVEMVRRVVDEIIETGKVTHAFLGVGLADYTVEDSAGYTLPGGGLVSQIVGGESAAAEAGILTGDVIVRYDGNPVLTSQDLIVGLRRYRAGDVVEFEILRGDETIIVQVELGERPEDV